MVFLISAGWIHRVHVNGLDEGLLSASHDMGPSSEATIQQAGLIPFL